MGRLGIVEHDRVELSNLQRQLLFETSDIGRSKADAAKDRIEELNPGTKVELFHCKIDENNARSIIKDFDAVIDGSDNFATRFAVGEACMAENIPLISAAVSGFSAQLSTFKPYLGSPHPCYRCLVPSQPEREITCEFDGVIGPLAGMMGSMQALEAMKEILDIGESLSGRLLIFDALTIHLRTVTLPKDPACRHCA